MNATLDGQPTEHPEWWITLDGQPITHGLAVWDYDLRLRTVDVEGTKWADPTSEFHKYWDGWFEMRTPEGEPRCSTMNGERMWTRHPSTGEPAADAIARQA